MDFDLTIIPTGRIEQAILEIRGLRVMVDADLAALYGVTTKGLNQAVKRNKDRFPGDFMFQLTPEEKIEVVTNCDHLSRLRFSPVLPYAFTEHGVLMLANILNSERAVKVSVQIVRTFVKLRESFTAHADLARKLETLEKRYDSQFKVVFEAIRQLMAPPEAKKRKIGFDLKERQAKYSKKGMVPISI
jgi:phage regulator Rha-like protein